jgi:KDO2-lipid IV(A) lauroyltransferase
MNFLFYIVSLIPTSFLRNLVTLISKTRIFKTFSPYKVTFRNLEMTYKNLNHDELEQFANESFIETILSGHETIKSWTKPIHNSGKNIFRIENNYLLNKYIYSGNGVAVIAIHNRSVDMLLKWINTKCETTTLYKKVKIKELDRFVRKQREGKNNKVYETTMTGVRKIFQAYKENKTICIAADQVPQEGMGEYIKLFNIDTYTTTLASSLVYKTQKPAVFICINSFENNKLGITIKPCRKDIYDESKHKLSLNKSIESLININPKDYSWEYKRYKKLLSGENPYKDI